MMTFNYIFTNFIIEENLDIDLDKLKIFCYNQRKVNLGREISNYGGWQSKDLLITEEILPLMQSVDTILKNIHRHVGITENIKLDNMWININQKSNFNTSHIHAGSLFSGVFYVSTPKNCGKIVFKNPNPLHTCFISAEDITTYNDFNSSKWSYEPKPNMILIFPSWTEHYVMPNESNEDRISISFNASINKDDR